MVQAIDSVRRRASGRVPPHNLEAEESLLGAMLLSRDAITAAVEAHVETSDFYKPAHGHIYEAIQSLHGQGEPADPVTVAEELRRADLLDNIGGRQALLLIQANTPASANAGHYARIVNELALLRRLIGVAGDIAEMGYDETDDVTETLDRAEALVFEVAERRVSDSMVGIRDALQDTLDDLESRYGDDSELIGMPTGFDEIDKKLHGLQRSNLVILAARPGMGKTSLALGLAKNVAIGTGKPVVFFSMEMGALELTKRLLSMEAGVDATKLWTANLSEPDWGKISHAVGRLAEAQLHIDDNPHCTVMEMRAKARRLRARHGDLGLVIVDYIQLMTPSSSGRRPENRQVEVSEISRGLKILARELECPVIALSQLNRQLEYRQDKRPMLADLRESGGLEQDADVVAFIYRDEVYNPESDDRALAEIIIAKHRNGPTGTARLVFRPERAEFVNMAHE
ncbi:MAG TPA: replicative DNA helicase [Acidimicrobiia bacterium]|nr:replicative DNA helicase [Acidimicrobiia bacterium]